MSDLRRDIITGRWVVMTSADGKSAQDFRCEIPYQNTPTDCAFCEGNESHAGSEITAIRDAGTAPNEPGWQVRTIPNHFPVLTIEENLKKQGVDFFEISVNPKIWATLARIGLTQVGDISWPEHVAIFTIPVRIAVQMNIPPTQFAVTFALKSLNWTGAGFPQGP